MIQSASSTALAAVARVVAEAQTLGDAEAAIPGFREALPLRSKALGPDDPSVANTLTGLGEALALVQ